MRKYDLKMAFRWMWCRKEAFIWLSALLLLALSNPYIHHYTLCPLDNLGFDYCPGCGLGRSIGFLFRLDFVSSFFSHPLGIPVTAFLISRSIRIFIRPIKLNYSTIKPI